MASNNTDWKFGEIRGPDNVTQVVTAHAAVTAGTLVSLKAAVDNGVPTVEASTGVTQPYGVACYDAAAGDELLILIRGITRIRNTCAMADPTTFGAGIALKGGKIVVGSASQSSGHFGINIGGTLADGETGLFFVDCLGGF